MQGVRLATEKRRTFRGRASVRFDVLQFLKEDNSDDETDTKNIERLRNLFRSSIIDREDPTNSIDALIDQSQLDDAIQASRISPGKLLDDSYLELEFPDGYKLRCLNGQDRTGAAKKLYLPGDRRWTVTLYLKDLDSQAKTTLSEKYSSEKPPDDGTFYYKIRKYAGYSGGDKDDPERDPKRVNRDLENKWLARLSAESNHKSKNFHLVVSYPELGKKLDKIVFNLPALRGGMRLSTLHKVPATKCLELHYHYLDTVRTWWGNVCGENKEKMQKITKADVEALQLTAPGACRSHAAKLYGQVREGLIFSAFSRWEREAMWKKVLHTSRDCLIPSLFSFFEDLNYLKLVSDCVKRLIPPSQRTILGGLSDACIESRTDQCVIQESDSTLKPRTVSTKFQFDLLCRQVWIGAMRDYLSMPVAVKNNPVANHTHKSEDEIIVHEFATLASHLGFDSAQIRNMMRNSADREIARNALLKARKTDRYYYSEELFEHNINEIVRLFSTAQLATKEQIHASSEVNSSDKPPRTCGIPHVQDQKRDRSLLFFDKLHGIDEEVSDEISSFFIRRSVYFAYFGKRIKSSIQEDKETWSPSPRWKQEAQNQAARDQAVQAARDKAERDLATHISQTKKRFSKKSRTN